jgi:hypothetical protein
LIGLFSRFKGTIAGNAISFPELPETGSARRRVDEGKRYCGRRFKVSIPE